MPRLPQFASSKGVSPSLPDEPAVPPDALSAAWAEAATSLKNKPPNFFDHSLLSGNSLSTSTSSHLSNILANLDLSPLPSVGTNVQIDVFAQEGLPINFASDRFNKKFGTVDRYERFTTWLVDGQPFEQWLISCTDDIYNGERKAGVEEFGQLTINRKRTGQAESEPRMIAALFPDPRLPREVYRISLRIGTRVAPSAADTKKTVMPNAPTPGKKSLLQL